LAINVFISYAHKDIKFQEELVKRLMPLERNNEIVLWHDGLITPGEKWDDSIKQHLVAADIIILLLSADFLASDYIFKEELPTIVAKRLANQLQLVPIVVRDVVLDGSNIEAYQCLPQDKKKRLKPIANWQNQDQAWSQIDKKIREIIKTITSPPAPTPILNTPIILGGHHIYTCDRVDQFDLYLQRTKGDDKVQYFCLFGQEYQSIYGFFNRVKYDKAGILLDYLNPNTISSNQAMSAEITFQYSPNKAIYIENIYKSLLSKFFNEIDDRASILNQTILDVLTDSQKVNHLKGKDYLCILLTIKQEDWDKHITPYAIQEVISSFFDHPIPNDKPTILLFLGLSYEEEDSIIEQEIMNSLSSSAYLTILPKLEPVSIEDIKNWFKKYNTIFGLKPKQLDKLRKQYFQDAIFDMEDVEIILQRIIERYNNNRLF